MRNQAARSASGSFAFWRRSSVDADAVRRGRVIWPERDLDNVEAFRQGRNANRLEFKKKLAIAPASPYFKVVVGTGSAAGG
jgi:hypothetical protein